MLAKLFKDRPKGFTLIELLIVIAIIAVLAVAFLPSVFDAPAKARDAQRVEDVGRIADFFNLQRAVKGTVPAGLAYLDPAGSSNPTTAIKDNIGDFGGVFPVDPGNGPQAFYFYIAPNSNQSSPYSFMIIAEMENSEDGNASNLNNVLSGTEALTDSGPYYVALGQK